MTVRTFLHLSEPVIKALLVGAKLMSTSPFIIKDQDYHLGIKLFTLLCFN